MWYHFVLDDEEELYIESRHITSILITPQMVVTHPDGTVYMNRRGTAVIGTVDADSHSVSLEDNEAEVRKLLGKPPLA